MLSLIQKQALGLDATMLVPYLQGDKEFLVHGELIKPLKSLQEEAREAGFDVQIVSAYRDFQRQLSIWNAKASGQRVLLDDKGNALNFAELSNAQKLKAIMRWSAVPGLSRHHWGCDVDIFDANAMCLKDVQLIPAEVEGSGLCAPMHVWLSDRVKQNTSFQFFRPYQFDAGAIAPELWHVSYLPLAKTYQQAINLEILFDLWQQQGLLLLDELQALGEDFLRLYIDVSVLKQPDWIKKSFE